MGGETRRSNSHVWPFSIDNAAAAISPPQNKYTKVPSSSVLHSLPAELVVPIVGIQTRIYREGQPRPMDDRKMLQQVSYDYLLLLCYL